MNAVELREHYRSLELLCERLEGCDPRETSALLAVASSMASDSAYDPWVRDPLKALDGITLSIDRYRDVLLVATVLPDETATIGRARGVLYVPERNGAVFVRVYAIADSSVAFGSVSICGDVSDDIRQSAAQAGSCSKSFLERLGVSLAPAGWRCTIHCESETDGLDELLVGTAGRSLTLPLFLTMVSASIRVPVRQNFVFTGAISDDSPGNIQVRDVGFVSRKRDAALANGWTLLDPGSLMERTQSRDVLAAVSLALVDRGRSLGLAERGNAAVSRIRLVGRDRECARLVELLKISPSRFVVVSGEAGMGKSTLALDVANRLRGDFPGGVWQTSGAVILTSPEPIDALRYASGEIVPDASWETTGAREATGRRLLIIDDLDVDSVAGADDIAAQVITLLNQDSDLVCLATACRMPEFLDADRIVLGPLDETDAWTLFSHWRPGEPEGNEQSEADTPLSGRLRALCRLAGGVPLILEWLARHGHDLSVDSEPNRFGRWVRESVDSLDDRVRAALLTLSVLAGRIQTDPAIELLRLAGIVDPDIALLRRLERASLVRREWTIDEEFWMVSGRIASLVQTYIDAKSVMVARDSHRLWCRQQLRQMQNRRGEIYDKTKRLGNLIPELNSALGFLRATGNPSLPTFVLDCWPVVEFSLSFAEREAWLETAMAGVAETVDSFVFARLLVLKASLTGRVGEPGLAYRDAFRALEVIEPIGPHPLLGETLSLCGRALAGQGDYERAMEMFSRSIHVFGLCDHPAGQVGGFNNRALALLSLHRNRDAEEDFYRAIALGNALGSEAGVEPDLAIASLNLGWLECAANERVSAAARFGRCLELGRSLGDAILVGSAWRAMATTLPGLEAACALALAESLLRSFGHPEADPSGRDGDTIGKSLSEPDRLCLTNWRVSLHAMPQERRLVAELPIDYISSEESFQTVEKLAALPKRE